MSKERLEEFREEIDFLDDSADMEGYHRFIDTLKNLYEDGDLNWIYRYAKEQAERVRELESKLDRIRFVNNDYDKQNKRYREALEFYADEYIWFDENRGSGYL